MAQQTPPSPPGTRIGGHLTQMRQDFLGFLMEAARSCGPVARFRAGPVQMVLLSEPDLIADVLVKRAELFHKTRSTKRLLGRFLGNGLISLEDMAHRQHRRLMQPAFHKKRIGSYTETIVAHTQQRMDGWQDGAVLDIEQEMTALTLGIVAATLFSADVAGRSQQVMAAMSTFADSLNLRLRSPLPLPDWLPTAANRRQRAAVLAMDELLEGIIRQRRAAGQDRGDLLSMLLESVDEDGSTGLSDREIRDELLTIFFAGHETSASALTWILHLLSQNPQAETRLREELAAVLDGRPPQGEDIARLPWLGQVVREGLRLYPPAWLFDREPVQDVEVGPYHIPKGRTIFISPYVVHRDPRFYEEPEQFRPERFAGDYEAGLPRFAYFPFGGGPRICIGQNFALAEISLILAALLQRVQLSPLPGQQVRPEASATLVTRGGLRMQIAHH